ncbi:MAG TPA: hypothetical protein VMM36_18350, partial [Opitutaceae bacterium]|nr:hypothetical protein [Opitutaceae bacterium]
MQPALALLHDLQEGAFRHLRLRPDALQLSVAPDRLRARFKAAGWDDAELAKFNVSEERRQTPLENPRDFVVVERAVRAAVAALAGMPNSGAEVAACNQIVFGTISTGDLWYSLIAVPTGDRPLVVFPSGVLRFAYLLSKCIALCFDYEQREERGTVRYSMNNPTESAPSALPASKPESGRRFHELVTAYALCGHPLMAPPYPMGVAPSNAAATLTDHVLCYIAAHAFFSALNAGPTRGEWADRNLGGVACREWVSAPAMLREADMAGVDIMARARRTQDGPEAFMRWAPLLFLHGSELGAVALETLRSGPQGSGSVLPLAVDLRDRAAELVARFPEHSRFRAEAMWMRELVDALWNTESANIERARGLGFAPGVVPRPEGTHGLLPMAYEEDGHLVPFVDVKGATRRREMEEFLKAAGQTRFEREWSHRDNDVVVCYRAALFSETAARMSRTLRGRGFTASHDDLILVPGEDWER